MIKIVLAEDQSMLRSALSTLLAMEPDLEVVGQAADGTEALRMVQRLTPDILVTDIEMPGLTGIELAAALERAEASTRVLIITTFARSAYLARALKAGVGGFLLKDTPSQELADAIRTVFRGGRVIDPSLANAPILEDPLSDRDRRILRLVEQGQSDKEIAAALNLSHGTVRNYLMQATEKLDVSNRIEAFRLARENGWL